MEYPTLKKEFGYGGVNCPSCRGADCPPFKKECINEEAFEDEFRFKEVYVDFIPEAKYIEFYWISQEWGKNPDKVFEEILRCFTHLGVKDYFINLILKDRDHKHVKVFIKQI